MKRHSFLLLSWLTISLFGILMVYSAGYIKMIVSDRSPYMYIFEQIFIIIVIFLIITIVMPRTKKFYYLMKSLSVYIFGLSFIFLVLVLLIGEEREQAKMVIDFFFFDFQPMEFYKIAVILYLSFIFGELDYEPDINDLFKKLLFPLSGIILIILQPDLGGALIILGVILLMLFYNGQQVKHLLYLFLIFFTVTIPILFLTMSEYQIQRIHTWLNPFIDAGGNGYQIVQSFIAISNGGITGSGFMNSAQKAGFLPVVDSDFIFAIIAEELGIIGVLFTISMYFIIAYILFKIGINAHERFGMLYCFGISSVILLQAFINIGGVTGVIPMTGVTLPFISKGLNSFVFMSFGLIGAMIISKETYRLERKKHKKQIKA